MQLRLEKVRFTYGNRLVLDNISLKLEPGKIVAICGPNGVGKSTLLKCINRILPSRGSIFLKDREVKTLKRLWIARQVGYVPQETAQVFSISVFEMVMMGRRPYLGWQSRSQDREKVFEILALMGISDLGLRDFNQLSGGQQQKVIIARALAQEPEILLLDEPLASLDLGHQLEVMALMQQLASDQKMLVIMTVHDLNLAAWYADQILMVREGNILCAGDPSTVLTPETIWSVYGVAAKVKTEEGRPYVIPLRHSPGQNRPKKNNY